MGFELKTLTWSDLEDYPFLENVYGYWTGNILELLAREDVKPLEKLHAASHDGILPINLMRRWVLKCVRDTPVGNGRTAWELLYDHRSRLAVETLERHVDGLVADKELEIAASEAWDAVYWHEAIWWYAFNAAGAVASAASNSAAWWVAYLASCAADYAPEAQEAQVRFLIEIIEKEMTSG